MTASVYSSLGNRTSQTLFQKKEWAGEGTTENEKVIEKKIFIIYKELQIIRKIQSAQ